MIATILQWLGVAPEPAQPLSNIDLFMSGHSIPAISAGYGQAIIQAQRQIEQELRSYILELEHENAELRADLAACNSRRA